MVEIIFFGSKFGRNSTMLPTIQIEPPTIHHFFFPFCDVARVAIILQEIKANVVSVCLCVRHRHSRIATRATAAGGRARCHGLLYIQCGCVMQFGIKRCAQWARRGCTGHDGRAKPAFVCVSLGLKKPGDSQSVRRSRVLTSLTRDQHEQ